MLIRAYVAKWISNYKKKVRAIIKQNRSRKYAQRRIIDNNKAEEVKTYWQRNSSRPIRMRDIKAAVWKQNEVVPWDSTLAKTL